MSNKSKKRRAVALAESFQASIVSAVEVGAATSTRRSADGARWQVARVTGVAFPVMRPRPKMASRSHVVDTSPERNLAAPRVNVNEGLAAYRHVLTENSAVMQSQEEKDRLTQLAGVTPELEAWLRTVGK
jgi:hypothetical protein